MSTGICPRAGEIGKWRNLLLARRFAVLPAKEVAALACPERARKRLPGSGGGLGGHLRLGIFMST
jgi:hypothetical protein